MTAEKELIRQRIYKMVAEMESIGFDCIALAGKTSDKDLDQFGRALIGTMDKILEAVA